MTMFTDDVYFIDRDIAQETALKAEKIKLHSGQLAIKNSYYDGEPLHHAPANLIHVPINNFSEYFLSHPDRIPRHLCPIKKGVSTEKEKIQEIEATFKILLNQLHNHIQNTENPIMHHQDTYFLDRDRAYTTALNQNRVKLNHPTIDGLQICYYSGEPFEEAPENLVYVPTEDIYDFFVNTRLRIPYRLEFSPETTEQENKEIAETYHELLSAVLNQRINIREYLTKELNTLKPSFEYIKQYRVFLMACRETQVMQYAAKYLAEAFRKLGHQVEFSIEQNDMEDLGDGTWHKKLRHDFNPHIVISINHQNNDNLHSDVFNVIWWQDPMPRLLKKTPLHWRKRDLVYSISPTLDKYLDACDAPKIRRQQFCIDTTIFKNYPEINREEKIVFIGSSYQDFIKYQASDRSLEVISFFNHFLDTEITITNQIINQAVTKFDIPFDRVFWKLYHYAIRRKAVQWICQNHMLPVEVYGYGWENDPIVSPFFKGSVTHGSALAKIYNNAKHALVVHPFEINSQRLSEVAACGAIPLVFDCRHLAEPPYWEDECIYFHSFNSLQNALSKKPKKLASNIAQHFTYEKFAKNIISQVEKSLNT